jgi:hypothetical protein
MTLSAISRRLAASSFLRRPPMRPSARGGGESGGGPFPDHGAFELGEGADHLHHHASSRRSGVDRLGDRAEARAGVGDALHDVQHVFQRA